VVATMVLAHEAKGTDVMWRPSRMLALGDSDQLTEALNVLLDNAAAHGSGSVRIEVRAAEPASTSVEIAVTDDGPGVPPELRRRIFAWGVSRPGSTGQGLGIPLLGCADGGAGDGADEHDTPTRGGRRGVAA
jgi:signal transduction histidine kinase